MCCICIPDTPIEDSTGRIKVYLDGVPFKTTMMHSPFTSCKSFLYCLGQFIPCSMGVTQCMLRKKVLNGDMSRYSCGQGYFDCLCFKAGNCCESYCPHFCAFLEGCCLNCIAVSATRMYIQDQYNLTSDKCDYRLIRINNCLQLANCICGILAIFVEELRQFSRILDCITNTFYHCVSGCMTAQVSFEVDERSKDMPNEAIIVMGDEQDYEKSTMYYTPPSAPIQQGYVL